MRTTVTLDPDVAAKLKAAANERGVSFKEALNSSVRRGLQRAPAPGSTSYQLRSRSLRARPGVNLDKALSLAGELEDAEIVRKLSLRK